MALTKQQRLAMIDFLVPLLNDEGKRQMHMDLLFAGAPRRPDLNLHGAPRETTTRIVLALESYQIEPGKSGLVDLLQQVSYDVGVDQQAQIEEWQTALLTPVIASPSSAPQPSMPETVGAQRAAPSPSRAELFAMPAPFAWVTVPAGKVTLEAKNESYLKTETTFDVPSFGIGKYPITIGQYLRFGQIGGYENYSWWTKKGWKWISENSGSRIMFQIPPSRLRTDVPVTVTWYEAMAFCAWLSETTNQIISLPTERQWQRAAQGSDGRLYPWGNEWNVILCNNQSDGFTSVLKYEESGDSPFGIVDIVGNAAEWCATNWRTGEEGGNSENARVVRGGSYTNQYLNFYRVTTRHKEWPTTLCGFRIVCLLE